MAEFKDREHYIPLRKSDLIALLCKDRGMTVETATQFRRFCTILSATFHFEYHKLLDELKDRYAPFDPDRVTKIVNPPAPAQRSQQMAELFDHFDRLLEKANFKRL